MTTYNKTAYTEVDQVVLDLLNDRLTINNLYTRKSRAKANGDTRMFKLYEEAQNKYRLLIEIKS